MSVDPLERVRAYVAASGVAARPLREAIAALSRGPQTLDTLIDATALPRRSIEGLLAAADSDLQHGPHGMVLRPERAATYRDRFAPTGTPGDQVAGTASPDVQDSPYLLADMQTLLAAAPQPVRSLDHVTATPATAVRRARWLDERFDLAGARLLCVGDHDLTSLAACAVNPELAVTVVDIDERILAFIDEQARRRGWDIRCLYADLRYRLPAAVTGWADLIFTDPPYTPDGVTLFLGQGLQALRDRQHGRAIVAYGYSDGHPGLGLKVQQAIQRMQLTFEAILPAFNRYDGADAIGRASDLYVCRPNGRTWRAAQRMVDGAATRLYTHGPQATEAPPRQLDTGAARNVLAHAAPSQPDLLLLIGETWPAGTADIEPETDTWTVPLARLLSQGLRRGRPEGSAVAAADLSRAPSGGLLRTLLATNADRLAALVPNNHPDLRNEAAQQQLSGLVAPKYGIRFYRSTPDPHSAIVVVERVHEGDLQPGEWLARQLLDRAHGTVGSLWRDAFTRLGRTGADSRTSLTKNEARTAIWRFNTRPQALHTSPIDLPRDQLDELLADVIASAGPTGAETGDTG